MIDFKKAIHLVSSVSAKGNLQNYFETKYPDEKIEIHSIHESLAIGPLNDLHSTSDFKAYADYWIAVEQICDHESTLFSDGYFNSDNYFKRFTTDFSKDNPLIIWHGNSADEKLMFYRYCSLLNDRELHHLDLNKWSENSGKIYFNSLAEINPKDLDGIFSILKKVEDDEQTFFAKEWQRLKNDQKLNRILRDGKLISVNEDYYDQEILANSTSEFQKASKIIGDTMEQYETTVGDYYLWYRIHVLIKQNVLESRGSAVTMRSLEIRKK